MKSIKAYLCFGIIYLLFLQSTSAQIKLKHADGNIAVRFQPYLYKVYTPTTYESDLTEMKFDALAGISGEKYWGEHLGIRLSLLAAQIRWETGVMRTHAWGDYGNYYTKYTSNLIQPEIAIRLYQQSILLPLRAFVELGSGLTFEVNGNQIRPSHPDPSIARLVVQRPVQKWYFAVLASTGFQYRWSNRWGAEIGIAGRLPIIRTFLEDQFPFAGKGWKNFQYGLNLACNYFLPTKK